MRFIERKARELRPGRVTCSLRLMRVTSAHIVFGKYTQRDVRAQALPSLDTSL